MPQPSELPFEYSIRSVRLRNATGADYAVMAEQRDRELEDFLADLMGTIADMQAQIDALTP